MSNNFYEPTKAQWEQGVSLFGINAAAEKLGFDASPMRLQPEFFFSDATLPCIVHWSGNHYVVVYKIKRNKVYIDGVIS